MNPNTSNFYKLTLAKTFIRKFGIYSQPLSPEVDCKELNVYFEEGSPAMFWLHIKTPAILEYQQNIQRKLWGKLGDGGGDLQPGSLVLARYKLDGCVYRAKVEHVDNVGDGITNTIGLRYIDYGNRCDIVSKNDLYTWDPLLEFVPAQAVLCTFYNAPSLFKSKTLLNLEENGIFTSLMSGAMKLNVHRRLHSLPLEVFRTNNISCQTPELEISLIDKCGRDVLFKISRHREFKKYFGNFVELQNAHVDKHRPEPCLSLLPLYEEPVCSIPTPVHLVDEPLVDVELDHDQVVLADIIPVVQKGLHKVSSWLERNKREDSVIQNEESFFSKEHVKSNIDTCLAI